MGNGNGFNQHVDRTDRDIAIEAFHRIDTHEKVCNEKGEAMGIQIKGLIEGQKEIVKSVDEVKKHLKSLYNRWWSAAIGGITILSGLCIWLVQQLLTR